MWLDSASQALTEEFWGRYGSQEPFPRRLEQPLAFALPVALVKLPKLQLRDVEAWLHRRGIPQTFNCTSRAIRGCLIAFRGHGIIFLDGTDPEDERRFTLAHEIAHFMLHYRRPRERALQKLGRQISESLDGLRAPTFSERLHAILASTAVGLQTELLGRDQPLDEAAVGLWPIEDEADRMALELLAPFSLVVQDRSVGAAHYIERYAGLEILLRADFGLPPPVARSYAQALLVAAGRGRSWLESVGLR